MPFRADLQGLRAIAVTAVVLYHAGVPSFSGGYVGVDIFFVISGYLITGLLLRELAQKGTIDFQAFYARRIRRLLPALTVVLLTTLVAGWALLAPLTVRELAGASLAAALYVSNFWFARSATNYLGGDAERNLVTHTWSLSVEEQFYMAWPALLLCVARLGSPERQRERLIAWLAAMVTLSFVTNLWFLRIAQPWAFFASPPRVWEFGIGALVCCIGARGLGRLSAAMRDVLAFAGLAAIAVAVTRFGRSTPFPGVAACLPVVGTALLLPAGAGGRGYVSRAMGGSVARTIGDLSYSWYLWHWPLLVLPRLVGMPMDAVARTVYVLASLLLGGASYAWIENRVRFSALSDAAPARSLALGASLTVMAAAGALVLRANAHRTLASGAWARIREAGELPRLYADGCHGSQRATDPGRCVYGDSAAGRTVYLVGDSHAAAWFPAFERMAREQRWRLVAITKSACPMIAAPLYNRALGREYTECATWRANVLRRIAADHPNLVVVGNSSSYLVEPNGRLTVDVWQRGMRILLEELRRASGGVVVMRDVPWSHLDMRDCLSRAAMHGRTPSTCDFDHDDRSDDLMFRSNDMAAAGLSRVASVRMSDLICPGTRCPSLHDGVVTYRDDHHITVSLSRELAPVLRARLAATGLLDDTPLRLMAAHPSMEHHRAASGPASQRTNPLSPPNPRR